MGMQWVVVSMEVGGRLLVLVLVYQTYFFLMFSFVKYVVFVTVVAHLFD